MYTEFRKLNLFLNVITKETIHMKCSRKKNTADSFRFHILKMIFVFCLLWNLPAFSQSGDRAVLKVYLNDAETGRNVKKARVTLEGFEIPAIDGKYNKKGNYYYFTEIPKGYNTVMSYHKDYNEKGFQDVNGLPKEVKLKLYDPLNVSYEFQNYEPDSTHSKGFYGVYVEDSYKIGIISDSIDDYNDFKNYLSSEIEKLNIDVELINPYLNDKKLCAELYFDFLQTEQYPTIEKYNNDEYVIDVNILLPLKAGVSNLDLESPLYAKTKDIVFYLRKKNGTKYKRYNDSFLKSLQQIKGIKIHSLLYKKAIYPNNKNYSKTKTKLIDENNYRNYNSADSSYVFFYSNRGFTQDNKGNYTKHKQDNNLEVNNSTSTRPRYQVLVENNQKIKIFEKYFFDSSEDRISANKIEEAIKAFEIFEGTGLGVLDIYQYISEKYDLKFNLEYLLYH